MPDPGVGVRIPVPSTGFHCMISEKALASRLPQSTFTAYSMPEPRRVRYV